MPFYVAATPSGEEVVHPVDEVLPPSRLGLYGAHNVLAFYAGAVIVPILLAGAIGLRGEDLVYLISADLFTCGIASIIQAIGFWNIGVRLPLLQGVTFTAVAPMISIGQSEGGGVDGLLHIYGAVIVAGVATFLFAPYYSRLLKLFPPVVTGTVITVIGVALLPVAAQQAGGGDPTAKDFGSFQNLELAGVTLAFIVLVQRLWRGKFLATIAVLLGLVFGTAVATVFGITDFGGVSDAKAIGATPPFHFGAPTFGVAAIVSMLIVMFITAVETTGDVFATGEIVEKPIRRHDIARAIRADRLATPPARKTAGNSRRRPRRDARRRPQLVPVHVLRRERRPRAPDAREEPLRRRDGGRDHDRARPVPEDRRRGRVDAGGGARRRRDRHVRHGRRDRHPDAVACGLPRRHNPVISDRGPPR